MCLTPREKQFKNDANTYMQLCIQAENEKDAIHKLLSEELQALKVHNMILLLENQKLKRQLNMQ